MTTIDKRTHEILSKYHDDPKSAVWLHKQSQQWIAKHKDLEIVAAKAGILFEPPQIIEVSLINKIAAVCVTGKLEERQEWSFGEATSYNSQNNYYLAMAEKRAKDRVILKLLGLHGFVYSDIEADDFKQPPLERLSDLIKQTNTDEGKLLEHYKVAKLEGLKGSVLNNAIAQLEKKLNANNT